MDPTGADVRMQWGVKIPLRDGVHLNATLYLPKDQLAPRPVIFTLTPYVGQTSHDRGLYFAGHGYPFLTVDVRGRGNSEGEFRPFINEAADGFDVTDWLAKQAPRFRQWFESGDAFRQLDAHLGSPSRAFQEWLPESMSDARAVTVKLFRDQAHPSVLHVPLGPPQS